MKLLVDTKSHSALVILHDDPTVRTHELSDDVVAMVNGAGELVALELLDTRPYGLTFDDDAAQRAISDALALLKLRVPA